MGKVWQLQEAKARFSELVNKALTEGPQRVTRRGESAVVVVSEEDFQSFEPKPGKRKSLIDLIRECPAPEIFDLIEEDRRKDVWRETEENYFEKSP